LNNLNNLTTSIVPPLLQRQNSAPTTQQQQQQNQLNDLYKPNNVNRPSIANTSASGQQPELQRKYSLPMNTTVTQPTVLPNTSSSSLSNATYSQAAQPPSHIMRKQSAPAIVPSTMLGQAQHTQPISSQQQQQLQNQIHGSPNRARDRNLFDRLPLNQDVVQLPLLKGHLFNYTRRCQHSIMLFLIIFNL
jgi:hypothetical protein